MGRPLGMKGSFFSTKLYGHHQVSNFNKSEHFSGSNKAFEILANLGVDPLIWIWDAVNGGFQPLP